MSAPLGGERCSLLRYRASGERHPIRSARILGGAQRTGFQSSGLRPRGHDQFARKAKAGANSAITQYFFTADAYFRFVDEVRGLGADLPIVPGIMPISNFSTLARFSDTCGADIPRWIRKRMEGYGDDADSVRAFGADVVTALCEKLLAGGAPGLHFYTLNNAKPTMEVWKRLGL